MGTDVFCFIFYRLNKTQEGMCSGSKVAMGLCIQMMEDRGVQQSAVW
jgi:hypothetical protein